MSRGPGTWERILQIRKKASQPNKNTDTIPCSMSPHSRTTSSRRLQDFPVCSALAPDSERPAILSGTDLYPCFCAVFYSSLKGGEEIIISSSPFFAQGTPMPSHPQYPIGSCLHGLRALPGCSSGRGESESRPLQLRSFFSTTIWYPEALVRRFMMARPRPLVSVPSPMIWSTGC